MNPPLDDTSASSQPPPTDTPTLDGGQKRNILIAMCLALMAVIASVSGLNVAQQDLAVDLGVSQGTILWVINAYTVALAALLMPIGAIGDRWGRKPVLLAGCVVFALSNVAAALAQSGAMLVAARTVAGVGAAMIMPVTLSVITSSFPKEERGQAIGIWAGVAGSGGLIGLFVSAAAVDILTWRWLFVLPVALVVVAGLLAVNNVPNSREHADHPFDVLGSVSSLLAIGGLVLGIHEGPERGWGDALTLGGLAIGLVALAVFVFWELRHPDPLLDIRVFSQRALSAGSVTLMILFATMFGIFLVLFPYFQAVVGWSALRSAVGLLPMAAMMMPTSAVAPQVAKRIGSRSTMLIGVSLAIVGISTLALQASVEGGYFSVLPGLLVMGLGFGFAMSPSTEAITGSLPEAKQGVGSALNDTSREVGGALGVALLGSFLSAGYESAIEPALVGLPPELAEPARDGIGGAMGAAQAAGPAGPELISAAQHAFVDGWVQSMWIGVGMLSVALVFLLVRGPRRADEATVLSTDDLEGTPVDAAVAG